MEGSLIPNEGCLSLKKVENHPPMTNELREKLNSTLIQPLQGLIEVLVEIGITCYMNMDYSFIEI